MFARASKLEIAFRVLVIVAMLFSAPLNSFSVQAADETTPGATATETPTTEPVMTATETVVPVRETPTPTVTPAVTNTMGVTDTVTPTATSSAQVTAPITGTEASPATPTPTLILAADPSFVTPSGNIILRWTIAGVAPDGLTLQIHIPNGISLQGDDNPGTFDEANRTLSLTPASETGELLLRANPDTSDVLIDAILLKNDETVASTNLLIPSHEQFTLDQKGGTITAMDGKLKLDIPADVLPEKAVIEVGAPSGDAVPPYSLRGKPFEIKAHAEKSGDELHHFPKELTIFVSYADLGIPEQQEGDLKLYWYDPASGEWNELPSMVDTENKTLEALTDHFTVFDMNIDNWQAGHIPTINSFQVSNFTGAATYSLPVEVPAGPGGFQPSVELAYNSQIVDQSTTISQPSWVGMGWSLDTGSIEIDSHGTGWSGDDTYTLNVAGISTRLLPYGGTYHATDENFWKITFTTSPSSWTVQDKQGNTYTFTHVLNYPYQTGSCSGHTAEVRWNDYEWMLTKVTNIFGQEIQYTYFDQITTVRLQQYYNDSGSCRSDYEYSISATYPSTITYAKDGSGNPRYRVRYDIGSDPSRMDMPSYWSTPALYSFKTYERYRLQNIYVEQDSNGDGSFESLIRRYQLTYVADTDPDIIFPGFTWAAGGKTSTLKSVRQYGADGGSALPPVTFTYGDNLHMTKADNGYGGTVEFEYRGDTTQNTLQPWYYNQYASKSHTTVYKFG